MKLYCLPDEQVIEVASQETVLHATLKAGIPHAHACGGKAHCSTCRVQVLAGKANCSPRNPAESVMADQLSLPDAVRLGTFVTFKLTTIPKPRVLGLLYRQDSA